MACPCNTPTPSGGNLPSSSNAYLTDPVTAPSQSCYTPPEDLCAPRVSRLRQILDYIPGWLQKLTPASMGKMLIAVGDVLHYFKPLNKGPLYFDGENITVGAEATLTVAAKAESVHQYGHLALAKKVSKPQILPSGQAVNLDFYEVGVQGVGEIGFGQMVGLTKDNLSGGVRLDVIAPEEINFAKKPRPKGFKRLGYVETTVDGGCGMVPVKQFYAYEGATFSEGEILGSRSQGLPAILIPSKKNECGDWDYTLGYSNFVESNGVVEDQVEEEQLKLAVIRPIYGDAECEGKITAFETVHIPVPASLALDYSPAQILDVMLDVMLDEPIQVFSQTKTTGPTLVISSLILPDEIVPESANYLIYSIHAKATSVSPSGGTAFATILFTLSEQAAGTAPEYIRVSGKVGTSSSLQIASTDEQATTIKIKIREDGARIFGSMSTVTAGSGGSHLATLKVFLIGYGRSQNPS